ncbi:hypothetical protein [Synechococcus sp. CBW1006]|uniref:hypothetical protein n=1 Tax=Synechococcus sp. CBW1006 TaxID=1353138 RepID=UPI0018CD3C06|nr:hypothetical protein [Synechococcus sp. CBW1006]QPN66553.1 hypothetical protein H8F26_17820 [Synechococcus sp. CBW1006]
MLRGCVTAPERIQSLKRLVLKDLENLTTIDDLAALSTIEEVIIKYCSNLVDMGVLGSLPNLESVSISGCTKLVKMPERWPDSLRHLFLTDLATRQIGDLPPTYDKHLHLQTVHGLETVENLRMSIKIPEILLTMSRIPTINDLTPLASNQDLWINIEMEGKSSLPDAVVEMLSKLPVCRLRLVCYRDIDLTNLTRLENLIALDLDNRQIKKDELRPILNMNALEYLQFPAGSLPELGGCTFNTASKVAKVKMQLLAS